MTEAVHAPASHGNSGRHAHAMPFGATLLPHGGVRFRLWAPALKTAELLVHDSEDGGALRAHAATAAQGGWFECTVSDAAAGTLYQWRVADGLVVPDPASRFNPKGVHGPSCVVDPCRFAWDTDWRGRPWAEAVIYEMHVGTFTPEGTYAAAEAKLEELARTGITAVELMPLSDFPGAFGWGYDGVLPFAPHAPYGDPEALKRFIQSAHRQGLMVFLDVVYNHFGPDGNYLGTYAPQFFSQVHRNPWGNSLNFDREGSDTVRDFFVQNALYWLQEYRFDGLRLDAIHAIVDDSALDVIDELAHRVRDGSPDRHVHLVLENEDNGRHRLPSAGRYDAQWNDDFHHVMHVVLTGEDAGYYRDYGDRPVALLARSLANGFLWEGAERSPQGARQELQQAPAQPLGAMVNFLNNHDQSGNRAFGERMVEMVPPASVPVATALVLLTPATPMLFAGEEFGARTPFLYFADWKGDLRDAVTEGRLRDFGHFAKRANGETGEPPAPCERSTFEASRLDWAFAASESGQAVRGFIARVLVARRSWFVPRQSRLRTGAHETHMLGERTFVLRWRYHGGEAIELQANMQAAPWTAGQVSPWSPLADAESVFAVDAIEPTVWAPWSARWTWGRET
ncbi:malto-oligosyltrehalose trehalohydrolase [Xylophilus ampelinus]|uniref:Malto-oligosyltrehalose trehalohydrolase n=1 Tax=Xylophilus ampelinus TaxID=54067 RepID=A0A318SPS4_9BURK|nr:malto-oligosyltrehalose trehalohydrolase [Xylophilus ampelinus]MCS4511699.1 malto-oligosyltrehalose trehalohydrolase [Xylophilus ampelinus]PYE73801.1 maltooligosyl trehalose hydrolase [Xylophilus ampelinus]